MIIQDYNLRPLWDALLEIFTEFNKICSRNNLRFYVTGGTAIGALRHNGFIPWDDDFDIIMPRPDYIRFMELYSSELPNHYLAVDFRNTPNYENAFGKIIDNRPNVVATISKKCNLRINQGIFIDIIPIDGMPKAILPFISWQIRRMGWRKKGDLNKQPFLLRPFWWLLAKCLHVPDNSTERQIAFEKWLTKWDYYTSPAAEDINSTPQRRMRRAFDHNTYGEPIMVKFENYYVPLPREIDIFMNVLFGDWKKLPPVEKRVPSHMPL